MKTHLKAAALLSALVAAPAAAHHPMGGALPSTLSEGLLSGLGHPVIGLDHLAFLVAAGLIAGVAALSPLAPLAFVAASLAGVALHLALVDLPATEPVVALSVAAAGAALIGARAFRPAGLWAACFAFAGLFHGYAYGESIIGAEPAPLGAYLVGLALVQSAIALGAWRLAALRGWAAGAAAPRIAGGVALGVGLSALAGQIAG